ncbi:MAG: zinc ribbon domain-containing protein, partial [Acidimicrobiia bacterium]
RPRRPNTSGNVISVTSDGPSRADEGPYEEFSLEEPPREEPTSPAPSRPSGGNGGPNGGGRDVDCPSCGALNPANNRHCQECGARLRQGPLPTAPRPAVQATAGVRAALAISGLLLGVILIALFFNIFTGDDSTASESTTTTSTTVPVVVEPGPIDILDQSCEPPGIGSLICANLTSGTTEEYQVSWEETSTDGVKITFTFFEQMAISQIQWRNIEDPTRFRQNYRASSIVIQAQDSLTPTPASLTDQPGTQLVPYSALNTATLEITVVDVFQAEVVEDNVFDELAIDEITIIGRPVIAPTGTTAPADTGSTSTTTGG